MAVLLSGGLGRYVVGLVFVRKSGKEQMMGVVLNWLQVAIGPRGSRLSGEIVLEVQSFCRNGWLESSLWRENPVYLAGGVGQAQGPGS